VIVSYEARDRKIIGHCSPMLQCERPLCSSMQLLSSLTTRLRELPYKESKYIKTQQTTTFLSLHLLLRVVGSPE
jgi:hypothetical protein